jgi:hypothetical protein
VSIYLVRYMFTKDHICYSTQAEPLYVRHVNTGYRKFNVVFSVMFLALEHTWLHGDNCQEILQGSSGHSWWYVGKEHIFCCVNICKICILPSMRVAANDIKMGAHICASNYMKCCYFILFYALYECIVRYIFRYRFWCLSNRRNRTRWFHLSVYRWTFLWWPGIWALRIWIWIQRKESVVSLNQINWLVILYKVYHSIRIFRFFQDWFYLKDEPFLLTKSQNLVFDLSLKNGLYV